MPRVNNVEDAKMEIDALLKERSLLRRLRVIVADEVKRLSGSNFQMATGDLALRDRQKPH
jgi:hypothetical protein